MSKLVRYISPFGSPAYMTREQAERHLKDDDRLYVLLSQADALSEQQRRVGPPYYYDALAGKR